MKPEGSATARPANSLPVRFPDHRALMFSTFHAPGWRLSLARFAWVLVLWPGPLPMVHSHGTLCNSVHGLPELAQHLDRFHPDVDALDDLRFDLHLHWVLIQDLRLGSPGTEPMEWAVARPGRSQPLIVPPPSPRDFAMLAAATLEWQERVPAVARFSHPAHFFGTFCSQLSLPERLGVMLL